MKKNKQKITQHSPEWLAAKLLKIGGSEIWSLCWHYKKQELMNFGVDLNKDKPFRSPLAVFIKVRHGVQDDNFDTVNRDFGIGMEGYIGHRLARELPAVKVKRTQDFIVNPELHPLACCSPDGYLNLQLCAEIEDVDKQHCIKSNWGRGASEKKTARYHFNFEADSGARWQYIFQHQFQMMVMGLKWGILSVLVPKLEDYDSDFEKGQMLQRARTKRFKELDQYYDLFHYTYARMPAAEKLILESLEAFAKDLANDNYEGLLSKDNLEMEVQDKIALGLAFPNRYGTLTLDQSPEHQKLNTLLIEQALAQEAEKAAKIEKQEHRNFLVLHTRKYSEVRGSSHRMAWDVKGNPRFYKLK